MIKLSKFYIVFSLAFLFIHCKNEKIVDLAKYELSRISQNGENGILEKYFNL